MNKKWEKAFDEYTKKYDMSINTIRFKYKHSYEVEKLMRRLAQDLHLNDEEVQIAELIGLLHDIGRFEQIRKYGKCSDVKTNSDHADESCIYLFDEKHIRDFIDDDKYDSAIKNAIKWHNKLAIPNNLEENDLLFSKMIRDMDKVDIYRVVSEEYTYEYDKKEISEKVIDAYNKKMTIDSRNIKSKSDNTLQSMAFLFDMNFNESFKILKEEKYFEQFLNIVEVKNGSITDFNKKKKEALKYIDERI